MLRNVYYTDSLPEHWIVEHDDGLWLEPANGLPWTHSHPYKGHRQGLKEAHTIPDVTVNEITASHLAPRAAQHIYERPPNG